MRGRQKNLSLGLLSGITWLAEWCQTVIPRDGFLYLSFTPMMDSFSCITFISESGFFIMQSLWLQMSDILWLWHLVTSLHSVMSTFMMVYHDVLYNPYISLSNTWKFLIFIFPTRHCVCEIRFASIGVICGNPYPVCKKMSIYNTRFRREIWQISMFSVDKCAYLELWIQTIFSDTMKRFFFFVEFFF